MLLLFYHLLLLGDAELHIVSIVCVLTCRHILSIALDPALIYCGAAIHTTCSSTSSTGNASSSGRGLSTTGPAHHLILPVADGTTNLIIVMTLHFEI